MTVFRVYFVSETAQVELKSERVQAPASSACPPGWLMMRQMRHTCSSCSGAT